MVRIERRERAKNSLSCAFTGHRPQTLGLNAGETDELRTKLRAELLHLVGKNYTHFMSGGALGFDMLAAEEVLVLRSQLPFVTLEMVLPWRNQPDKWSPRERQRHGILLESADTVTVIDEEYSKDCLFRRNRFLVDESDVVLAFYRNQPGGTRMTVRYAESLGREVIYI